MNESNAQVRQFFLSTERNVNLHIHWYSVYNFKETNMNTDHYNSMWSIPVVFFLGFVIERLLFLWRQCVKLIIHKVIGKIKTPFHSLHQQNIYSGLQFSLAFVIFYRKHVSTWKTHDVGNFFYCVTDSRTCKGVCYIIIYIRAYFVKLC